MFVCSVHMWTTVYPTLKGGAQSRMTLGDEVSAGAFFLFYFSFFFLDAAAMMKDAAEEGVGGVVSEGGAGHLLVNNVGG